MTKRLFPLVLAPLACLALLLTGAAAPARESVFAALPDGVAAYIYGYPLVTMEMTRRVMTNVARPAGTRAPMGQFVRMREYPTAAFRDVTAPNADTLYTTAWLDVGKEPWILQLPEMPDRYALFPLLDAWTEVFEVPGTRTTGTGAQTYAITGPDWHGKLPPDVVQYRSPTALVWLLGRIYCTGTPEDYAEVHRIQDAMTLTPLSAYGKPWEPPVQPVDTTIDMRTAVREQVNALSADEYFDLLARLLKDNPPSPADAPMVARLARLGIVPGEPFDRSKLSEAARETFDLVPHIAQQRIMLWLKEGILFGDLKLQHGWLFTTRTGRYGTAYLQRALITAIGLGANRPEDAVYPTSEGPSLIAHYSGEKRYVMHFPAGRLPPVKGFWSLTMYDKDYFFVDNPLDRYSISPRQDLKTNADGSVDLYIQHQSPGADKESNWLPAPPDQFILMLRLYWPQTDAPSILDGSWVIPAVEAVD